MDEIQAILKKLKKKITKKLGKGKGTSGRITRYSALRHSTKVQINEKKLCLKIIYCIHMHSYSDEIRNLRGPLKYPKNQLIICFIIFTLCGDKHRHVRFGWD